MKNTHNKNNKDWWARVLGIIAIAIAIISALLSYLQYNLNSRSLKTNLNPIISCLLEKQTESDFFTFRLRNKGDIEATNLSVNYIEFIYKKSLRKIKFAAASTAYQSSSSKFESARVNWIYRPELSVNEEISETAGGSAVPRERDTDQICILIFELTYYRSTDGNKYEKRCDYYIDYTNSNEILTHKLFMNNKHYQAVESEIAKHLKEDLASSVYNRTIE